MTVPTDALTDLEQHGPRPRRFAALRTQTRFLLGLVVGGIALGLIWRLLVPLFVHLGDSDEQAIGADLTLVVVGLVAGIGTAVYVVARPGPTPGLRSGAAILGSLLGNLLAWPVGNLVATPALSIYGPLLAWPLGTGLGLFVAAMIPATARRLNEAVSG